MTKNKKNSNSRPWPSRIRSLIGPRAWNLAKLSRQLGVDEGKLLDWLSGKGKPNAKVSREIERLEKGEERNPLVPFPDLPAPPRERLPALPRSGPLSYARYLEILVASGRGGAGWDEDDDDERPRFRRPWGRMPEGPSSAVSARRREARLAEARKRHAQEIAEFPITKLALDHGLAEEELRILARLAREDVAVFEGRGSAPGRALARLAAGGKGDVVEGRKYLGPSGKLRTLGLLEKAEGDEPPPWQTERTDSSSVLFGRYRLTEEGRSRVLGPLLDRGVAEHGAHDLATGGRPRFDLDRVVLPAAHRKSLEDLVAELAHRDTIYRDWGMDSVVRCGKGRLLLFEGPPGTGKTMTAEALAGRLGVTFMTASFPKIVSMWVGETEKNLAKLFREAKRAGALLFIDEADGLFATRDMAVRSWEIREANVLLKEVEEFEGICVLATNNEAVLDRALESRVALRLRFEMPDAAARERIWRSHLPSKLPLAEDVDLAALARKFEISGRDIKQAVLAAVRTAVARDGAKGKVAMRDLETAAAGRTDAEEKVGF